MDTAGRNCPYTGRKSGTQAGCGAQSIGKVQKHSCRSVQVRDPQEEELTGRRGRTGARSRSPGPAPREAAARTQSCGGHAGRSAAGDVGRSTPAYGALWAASWGARAHRPEQGAAHEHTAPSKSQHRGWSPLPPPSLPAPVKQRARARAAPGPTSQRLPGRRETSAL